ncbi:hypothetical protein AB4305_24950 [Nocardia sp. 2YAB30]|uniref:hypothetical protein n=1 Tax=Nocardia sp. 2YAB30 TaxID=3233022 RepID=UPI003F95F866
MTPYDMEALASLEFTELLDPLECILSGEPIGHSDWRGLVEILTARLQLATETAKLSANDFRRALNLYDEILRRAATEHGMSSQECAERLLNLSSVLFRRYPPQTDIPLLDPNHIVGVFLREVPITLHEAAEQVIDWWDRDLETIKRLRYVKNLVVPASQALRAASYSGIDERIAPWEQLIPQLP